MTLTDRRDPVETVASLTDTIREACVDTDATRALPRSVVDGLRDAGVFRQLSPAKIGGDEIDPVTFLRLVEQASYIDGSVGWCVMIGGCYATFGGLLHEEGARRIYGAPESISAGGVPAGRDRGRGRRRLPGDGTMDVRQRIEPCRLVPRRRRRDP
jgi:alkylation response protein AidB-like acyl-CoA dehydrogenase